MIIIFIAAIILGLIVLKARAQQRRDSAALGDHEPFEDRDERLLGVKTPEGLE